GFRVSIENRVTLARDEAGASVFQLAPFFDAGAVRNNPDNPNLLPEQTFLAGLGIGLLWEPTPGFSLRLDFAIPLIDLDDRGVNPQDDGFNFRIGYQF
ncbi:MAG: BamA/TamA family outer membrane protein, partial [Cyanothece sp. SIO1E1]|nr:BamA/TamA family outer membrane protein [Cyanothece sp. SIO1E1]NET38939.1 BamA/TamA family outer membrane protein [Cyanothece sp. SIO1E1]